MSRENQADSSTNQTTPGQAGADFCPCQDQPKDDASSACLAQTPEPAEVSQQPAEAETFDQESPEDILQEYKGFTSPMIHQLNLFFGFCYKLCYRVGIKSIRVFRKGAAQFLAAVVSGTKRTACGLGRGLWKVLCWLCRELSAPFVVLGHAVKKTHHEVKPAFAQGKREGFACLAGSSLYVLGQFFRALLHLLNYAAPVAAVYFLIVTANYFANVDYALAVEYNGYDMGYVSDLTVYDDAEKMLNQRLAAITVPGEEDSSSRVGASSYSVAFVPDSQLADASALCDKMIEKSTSDLVTASGVYVDGEFLGAVPNGDSLREYLESRLETAESDEEDSEDVVAAFVKEVKVEDGLYPSEGLKTSDGFVSLFEGEVSGEKTYEIQEGDTAYELAWNNGLSLEQFYSMNPWAEELMLPGDEVVLAKSVPYLQIQLSKRVEYTEEVAYQVERVESDQYSKGYVGTVTEGQKGENLIVASVTTIDGMEVSREVLDTQVITEPVNEKVVVGTKPTGYATAPSSSSSNTSSSSNSSSSSTYSAASGSFMWPVDGGRVTCRIWGYPGHTGMDISAPYGTNVRAADSGIVEATYATQYAWGYGRYILINHGNGFKTLYAHNSAVYVSAGQWVNKGDVIAAVGMTGNATGNHLHFEVRINGSFADPAAYIGTSYWR